MMTDKQGGHMMAGIEARQQLRGFYVPQDISDLGAVIDRLKAINAELLEALEAARPILEFDLEEGMGLVDLDPNAATEPKALLEKVDAAIRKAKGESSPAPTTTPAAAPKTIMYTGKFESGAGPVILSYKGVEVRANMKGRIPAMYWYSVYGSLTAEGRKAGCKHGPEYHFDVRNVPDHGPLDDPAAILLAIMRGIDIGVITTPEPEAV
jgi:hypothetical protein